MRAQETKIQEKPQKQGGLYSLNLGQNNGPFLSKDIMITNQKSLVLLSGRDEVAKSTASILANAGANLVGGKNTNALELEEPPDMYDEKQQAYVNYDERYKTKGSAAENLASNTKLQQDFEFYKELKGQYRKDLEQMHELIHNSNMNNIREVQPMLKDFHQQLKDKLHEEKNENYKLQRELEQLNREKLQIQQQILFSHKRILELEKLVGINKVQNEEEQQQNPENEEESDDYD